MNRIFHRPGFVFALVLLWKILLAVVTVQPIPANDSFFYDGPVVNYVLHGRYINPSLSEALPISGEEVFSAYPPLYQAVLLPWVMVFGTSAYSVVLFHVTLFCIYAFLVYRILKQLGVPTWTLHFAGAFLLGITFHDRPDSLAHVLGMAAIFSWVKSREAARSLLNSCLAGVYVILCLATSLQIGAVYLFIVAGLLGANLLGLRQISALIPLMGILVIPFALVLVVQSFYPRCWEGFLEHARQTPTFSGFRMLSALDLLKVVRTVPGVLMLSMMALAMPKTGISIKSAIIGGLGSNDAAVHAAKGEKVFSPAAYLLFFLSLTAALVVTAACLIILAANVVAIANSLQPLIVGLGLALFFPQLGPAWSARLRFGFKAAVLLVSIRAIGMTTWGAFLAADVGYGAALKSSRAVLDQKGTGMKGGTLSLRQQKRRGRDFLSSVCIQLFGLPLHQNARHIQVFA